MHHFTAKYFRENFWKIIFLERQIVSYYEKIICWCTHQAHAYQKVCKIIQKSKFLIFCRSLEFFNKMLIMHLYGTIRGKILQMLVISRENPPKLKKHLLWTPKRFNFSARALVCACQAQSSKTSIVCFNDRPTIHSAHRQLPFPPVTRVLVWRSWWWFTFNEAHDILPATQNNGRKKNR